MPYELLWEPRGVVKRFFGRVTAAEVHQAQITVESDERFDDLRYVINDSLAIEEFVHSVDAVHVLAAIDGAASLTNANVWVAVVATHPEIIRLAEIYKASPLNPYPTQIVSTVDEARTWIGNALRMSRP